MILPIFTEPEKILHKKSAPLDLAVLSSAKIKRLIADMAETMVCRDGVGLAAPQIGESVRLVVIAKEFNPVKPGKVFILINPVWEKKSILKKEDEEGCLSVPGVYGKVRRYTKISVQALDQTGKTLQFTANDMLARIIQHEVDHLDGVLFIEKAKDLRKLEKSL